MKIIELEEEIAKLKKDLKQLRSEFELQHEIVVLLSENANLVLKALTGKDQ